MGLEQLDTNKLIGPQQDVETIETWADRNGITYDTARSWAMRGVLPTVKLGKRRMVNSAMLWHWLAPDHLQDAVKLWPVDDYRHFIDLITPDPLFTDSL